MCSKLPLGEMIKIIIYVDIAFFYRKANILHRWSKILHKFYWNKGVCHCCRLIDSDENLHRGLNLDSDLELCSLTNWL